MSDLQVVAILKAKPGAEELVGTALRDLVGPTQSEAGCLSYELFESASAPGTFVTIETWRSQEDLDGHFTTPHVQQALAGAGDYLDGDPAVHPLRPVAS
jgi:quinol monooxygenase YgiN